MSVQMGTESLFGNSVELVVARNSADARRGIARYFSLLFPGPFIPHNPVPRCINR
ncbi:hypothetical protein C8J56DRAFT_1165516 [Mycena floridula]|nr:hypothetical protein C8J56DRAFT_1165516 [Mycena floridula]